MYMKKRTIKVICAAMAAMMLMTGCGSSSSSGGSGNSGSSETAAAESSGTKKDSVTIRALSDQTTFDPYKSSDQNQWEAMYGLYDTLFREENSEYVPNIIEDDYSFNDNGTELTMTLKD